MSMLSQTIELSYSDGNNLERIADSLEKISATLNTMLLIECYKDYFKFADSEEEFDKAEKGRIKLIKSIIEKSGGLTKDV